MRFLCLHGGSTSGEIFEIQAGGLTTALEAKGHKFHFINGRLNSDCEPELRGIVPPPYFNHYPRDQPPGVDLKNAIEYTHRLINRDGPFDAVMGFSQGAALAFSLLQHHAQTKGSSTDSDEEADVKPLFKAAVFICAGAPYELSGNTFVSFSDPKDFETPVGDTRRRDGRGKGYMVNIPTAHIVGSQDALHSQGMKLYGLCDQSKAEVYEHGGRHMIPFDEVQNAAMVAVIEKTIERAQKESS
ncbi:serine hydrolase FSH [Aspergillus karnatakaensis]|uniref:serine hydrolase FSH n=1 Tax=Aspergillus karnatakaensis TaxID=1810916 RepID=UPI003CCD6295